MAEIRWKLKSAKYVTLDLIRTAWRKTIGFRLALWLDKKHPSWCWAEICTAIGLGYGTFDRDKWDDIVSNGCAADCKKSGSCWCRKMNKPETPEYLRKS